MEELLTLTKICELVAEGKFDEIPVGYVIRYAGHPPVANVRLEFSQNNVCLYKEDFPIPDKVVIDGSYMVIIPCIVLDEEGDPIPQEFGEVYITTNFYIHNITFMYTNGDNIKEYCKRLSNAIDYVGLFRKSDFAFDMQVEVDDRKRLKVSGLMPTGYIYDGTTHIARQNMGFDYYFSIIENDND